MNLLIIDDHQLFAEGLKFLLESFDASIRTAHVKDAKDALHYLQNNDRPDLILLDINLPGINGFSLMNEFQKINVWTPVLIISAIESPATAQLAIDSGASGFISKSCNSTGLISAVQTVLKGDIYNPTRASSSASKADEMKLVHITNRQKEILHLLSQGLLNKQIASELGISANTVKAHLYEIFRHLKVNNRTAAVKAAFQQGLISQI
ncbi:MAG: response regulator transcription factor [Cocleimonas sp.]|nr:response regulator transcription factor [Cocleimonas sp.]